MNADLSDPVKFYALSFSNVSGTLNVLESCKNLDANVNFICITTDKCYENKEWEWGYREYEPMGGYDPVSYTHLTLPTNREV